ncbi:AAA family ATPase [Streptomyces xanthochromogenes]|uniref:AAA family ATPase n=1 Tax=Streptomyces xanthochromogenes TaxID=67384 RepID=UPI00379199DC
MSGPLRPPRPCAPFAGRAEETRDLREFLAAETGPGPRVLLLHGPAGVGKSALAAHLVAPSASGTEVPVCWMPAGGEAPDPTAILLRVLGQLEADWGELALPGGGADAAVGSLTVRQACRRHFAARRALVVFDDVPSPGVAEALLAAFAQTRATVVLTARTAFALPHPRMRRHEVRPLDVHDCAVLAWRAGRRLPAGAEAESLLRLTGGLPSLIRLAGPLLEAGGHEAGETLTAWERTFPTDATGRATALISLAIDGLSGSCQAALERLLLYGTVPFGMRTAAELLGPGGPGHLDELREAGLLSRAHDDRWSLASARLDQEEEAARLTPPASHSSSRFFRSVRDALLEVLDGEATAATCDGVLRATDEYLDMALRPAAAREELTGPLARLLAMRCDAYRLAVLRRSLPDGRADLRAAFAEGVRDPECAPPLPSRQDTAGIRRAVAAHASGDLRDALRALGPEPSPDPGLRALADTLRGRILRDQGWVHEAEAAFTDAAARYHEGQQVRPGAWTSLHHAGLLLLTGRPDTARSFTEQALAVFRRTGDERGQAWCTTTLGRVHLATGHLEDAHADLTAAKAMHVVNGDFRGQAWSRYHLALAEADRSAEGEATGELIAALDLFELLTDRFGAAWAMHQLALVERDSDQAQALLHEAARVFRDIGCPHGLAWTELVLGAHPAISPYPALDRPHKAAHVEQARSLFSRLGDKSGELWSRYCLRLIDGDDAGVDDTLVELSTGRFTTSGEAGRLLEHRRERRPFPYRRDVVPRRARDTVWSERAFGPPVECRVRLTLLDGSPTRILLRVEAAGGHPWAGDGGRPVWLRAVGTPLTPADIEPAMSLVRPSPHATHGAEFTVVAHRAGLHRLRFTIADEQTGSVLQQVETEFDLPDTSAPHLVTAPHPEHARGA